MSESTSTEATEERVIRAHRGLAFVDFGELWRYRELFVFLAWRDILIRYKQTVIGVLWAVIQPVMTMLVFTVIFGKLAKLDSGGAPYPLLTLAALLPWQFFGNAVSQSSNSVVASGHMISKIYFPRLVIPLSAVMSGLLDFGIALILLFLVMLGYALTGAPVGFHWQLVCLPLFFLQALLAAVAVGLWLSALNVKYRDVKYAVPFLLTLGLYVSPVGFMSGVIPAKWRLLYSLNPLVGVIDGFRWGVLGPAFEPYWPGVWLSAAIIILVLVTGAIFFRSTERGFADYI